MLLLAPQLAYGYTLGSQQDPIGYPLVQQMVVLVMTVVWAFLIQTEPGMEGAWQGQTRGQRLRFWGLVLAVHHSFYLVVQFDFFYGSGPQTWLAWATWVVGIFIWALLQGRGPELAAMLDWRGVYLRQLAASGKQKA